MIFIYGYNINSRGWTRRKFHIRSILIEGEDFLPTGLGFLHLADQKFCLLLLSYHRPHYYLNCLIFYDGDMSIAIILSVQKYLLDSDLQFLDCMIMQVFSFLSISLSSLMPCHTHQYIILLIFYNYYLYQWQNAQQWSVPFYILNWGVLVF